MAGFYIGLFVVVAVINSDLIPGAKYHSKALLSPAVESRREQIPNGEKNLSSGSMQRAEELPEESLLALQGVGQPQAPFHPLASHCSSMMSMVCWGGRAAAGTGKLSYSGGWVQMKVPQHMRPSLCCQPAFKNRSFLLQEGEQVEGCSLSFPPSGGYSRRKERAECGAGSPRGLAVLQHAGSH